jgi:hypothetical protein
MFPSIVKFINIGIQLPSNKREGKTKARLTINTEPVSIPRTFHPVLNSGLVRIRFSCRLPTSARGWYYKKHNIMKN